MAIENAKKLINLGQLNDVVKPYIDQQDAKAIKSVAAVGNRVNFYTVQNPVTTGDDATTPAFYWDIPAEMVLDTTSTQFYPSFDHTTEGLPTELATWTTLDGKPVLALGVKTTAADGTITYAYSPVNLEDLVDIYVGSNSIEIDTTGENPAVKAKISAKSDNILSVRTEDGEIGLYVPPVAADGKKADKLVDVEGETPVVKEGQVLIDDGEGNIAGSGQTISEMFTAMTASDSEVAAIFGITLSAGD